MSGILGHLVNYQCVDNINDLLQTINLLGLYETKHSNFDIGVVAASWPKHDALLTSYYYENNNFIVSIGGDLVGFKTPPWENIINAIIKKNYCYFKKLRGTFAVSILDKNNRIIFLLSDRFSHYPIFYSPLGKGVIYSSSMSTFCKLKKAPEFNINWLYEFLYFNYPLRGTTFLKGVFRMPPATVFEYNLHSCEYIFSQYADNMRKAENLLDGKTALAKAFSVFSETVPAYFQSNGKVSFALTAGLDSRTLLSFAPQLAENSLTTHTYGPPGCPDCREASRIANDLGYNHIEIPFDKRFLADLPNAIYRTIYLSNGLERLTRATLEYSYRELTNAGKLYSAIITGVSGDHLFRDHLVGSRNAPLLISSDMMRSFQNGKPVIDEDFFRVMFQDNFNIFRDTVLIAFENILTEDCKLNDPQTYLSFLVYEVGPKLLGGYAAIVNNYSQFRSPYWDPDIVQLAYEIEYSTLGFSLALPKKDRYREKFLQAYITKQNSLFSNTLLQGYPLSLYALNNKFIYFMLRFLKGSIRRIESFSRPSPTINTDTDWSVIFNTVLREHIDDLLLNRSELSSYLSQKFIDDFVHQPLTSKKTLSFLNKILTAEIILRLIKKRWRL